MAACDAGGALAQVFRAGGEELFVRLYPAGEARCAVAGESQGEYYVRNPSLISLRARESDCLVLWYSLDDTVWATTNYDGEIGYDDTPKYEWNASFRLLGLKTELDIFNSNERDVLSQQLNIGGSSISDLLDSLSFLFHPKRLPPFTPLSLFQTRAKSSA